MYLNNFWKFPTFSMESLNETKKMVVKIKPTICEV